MRKPIDKTTYAMPSRRVADVPERQRPRELFDRLGAEQVTDAVLLAIVLRSGVQGRNVIELADALLAKYGSLTAIARASHHELAEMPGMGPVKAQVLKASMELAQRLTEERPAKHQSVRTPKEAAAVLRERAKTREEECFWVLLLDTKYRLVRAPVEISRGTLDASLVHPREAFREAIRSSSAAVLFLHNHPSGDPSPSVEDIRVTEKLIAAGRVVGIDVLDHIILGQATDECEEGFFSMREAKLLDFDAAE